MQLVANEALEEENRKDQDEKQKVDIEEFLEDLATERFRCPECGKVAVRWAGELKATMGWHPFLGAVPPIAEIRRMFEQASAHLDKDKDKIRPPPALSQST